MGEKFNPKITIIIPVYNGENFISDAINSAINQTYKNTEIIVINDGSTDEGKTEKKILPFGNKIKYIKKENGGVASALNIGIKESTGDYISWLSHDDIYLPDKLEEQVNALSKLKDKNTILFSNVNLIDENGDEFFTTDYARTIGKEKLCQGIYPVIKGVVNGCSTLISKECFKKVGTFNENLKTTNDYEMWIRLFSVFNSDIIEKPLIKYRVHKNQDTNKSPYYIEESNQLWIDIINMLKQEQIQKWGFDKFNVLMDLYFQMKNSKFDKAASLAYEKAKEFYQNNIPKVSIIMPCFNSEKYINKAINSVLEQTYRNFELIIVNDLSSDNTDIIVKDYLKKDFRIKYIKNEKEKGIAGAMNTGIIHSKGEYISRMDSDDIISPLKIEKQINFLENNIEYGICSVNISMIDKFGNVFKENIYPHQDIPIEWTFLWTNPIPNAPCMYRTKIIKENDIWFNNFETAEDYDFLRQLITKTKIYMINDTLYYYRNNKNSVYNTKRKETFKNSLEISKRFFKDITECKVPPFYNFLTNFYTKDEEPIIVASEEVYRFLKQTAEKFKIYYKWDSNQYKNVEDNIIYLIEKYSIYKYLSQEYGAIGADFGANEKEKVSSLKNFLIRIKRYINKNGIKKTILKIIKKIKDKLWGI